MNSRSVFRIALVAKWILIVVGIVLSFALEKALPPLLQEYLSWEAEQDLEVADFVALALFLVFLPLSLVASVGLFFFKNWARWLYLGALVVGYLSLPFLGPTVVHGLAYALDEVSVLLEGFIVGLAFYGGIFPAGPARE